MAAMNKSFITMAMLSIGFATLAAQPTINTPPASLPASSQAQAPQGNSLTTEVPAGAVNANIDRSRVNPLNTTDQGSNYRPEDRPPQSGLGLQMEPPQIVYPSPQQVTEDAVSDLELLQLTPEQMNRLKQLKLNRERAKATPYVTPAKPVTRTMFINLNAGVSPPTVRLSRGQLSTIVFSDANGQPWYISKVSVNCTLFQTDSCSGQNQQSQSQTQGQNNNQSPPTNILTLEPLGSQSYGNITVSLNGLPTPVIFILTSGQNEVDMRVDAKIPGRNPDAQYTMTMTGMPGIDNDLTSFLDGVPPKGSRKLKVTGMDGVDAWVFNNFLYVRANGDAQYPAYTKSARSTTGLSIYRFDSMTDSVTFTAGGRAITAFIENNDN